MNNNKIIYNIYANDDNDNFIKQSFYDLSQKKQNFEGTFKWLIISSIILFFLYSLVAIILYSKEVFKKNLTDGDITLKYNLLQACICFGVLILSITIMCLLLKGGFSYYFGFSLVLISALISILLAVIFELAKFVIKKYNIL